MRLQLYHYLNSGWIAWDDVSLTGPTVTTQYYYAGGQRVATRKNGVLHYLLGDHLGSTALTAYDDGVRGAELRYKAWGETRFAWESTPTTFQYTGQRNDAIIGLYFYNARYYDGALGRFIQADTIVPNPADPQALNRYSYVRNNALLYVDPSGHDPNRPILHDYDDYAGSEPSPLADLWLYRVRDNPHCPSCSNATIPGILDEQWIQDHPGYTYAGDSFKDRAAQWIAGNGGINGLTTSDLGDLHKYSGTISSAQETTSLKGLFKVTWKLGSELGLPLLGAAGQANGKLGSEGQQAMAFQQWQAGDPINASTRNGYPSWSTVRARYWKSEALSSSGAYSEENLARMRQGLAPQDLETGASMHLHHINGRGGLDPHNPANLLPVTPQEHYNIHWR